MPPVLTDFYLSLVGKVAATFWVYRNKIYDAQRSHDELPPLFKSFESFVGYLYRVYKMEDALTKLSERYDTLAGRRWMRRVDEMESIKREHYNIFHTYKELWREMKPRMELVPEIKFPI